MKNGSYGELPPRINRVTNPSNLKQIRTDTKSEITWNTIILYAVLFTTAIITIIN